KPERRSPEQARRLISFVGLPRLLDTARTAEFHTKDGFWGKAGRAAAPAGIPVETALHSLVQHTRKPDAEPVRIGDGEVTQTVIAIGNWNDDLCADLVDELPAFVDVGDHHSDIGEWKRWNCGCSGGAGVAECGEFGEKKAVFFPG